MKKLLLLLLLALAGTAFAPNGRISFLPKLDFVEPLGGLSEIYAWNSSSSNMLHIWLRSDDTSNTVLKDGNSAAQDSFTLELDTTNFKCSMATVDDTYSSISVNFLDQNAGDDEVQPILLTYYGGDNVNLTNYDCMVVRYYIAPWTGSDSDKALTVFRIQLLNAGPTHLSWTIGSAAFNASNLPAYWSMSFLKEGWHTIYLDFESAVDTNFDIATAAKITFSFTIKNTGGSEVDPDGAYRVTIDTIKFVKQTDTAQWALCFDDGFEDAYETSMLLDSYGLKGTFFIIGSLVDTGGRVTLAELQDMQKRGHLIANHGWKIAHLSTDPVSETVLRTDIDRMTRWMRKNGFAKGSQIWAVPGGTPDGSNTSAYEQFEMYRRLLGNELKLIRMTKPVSNYPSTLGTGYASIYREPGIVFAHSWNGDSAAHTTVELAAAISQTRLGLIYTHSLGAVGEASWDRWKAHFGLVAVEVSEEDIKCITLDEL